MIFIQESPCILLLCLSCCSFVLNRLIRSLPGDVLFVNDSKANGAEVIDLVESPEKSLPDSSDKEQLGAAAPRRSSRNANKSRSYAEKNEKEETPPPARPAGDSEESDIEEVLPQDPLGKDHTPQNVGGLEE